MKSLLCVSQIGELLFELLVPVTGEKEKEFMKKKTKYQDEPMDEVRIVEDFLPSPEALIYKEETVKITIALSRESVDFFKKIAKNNNTQYQKLIRRLLDEYAMRHRRVS